MVIPEKLKIQGVQNIFIEHTMAPWYYVNDVVNWEEYVKFNDPRYFYQNSNGKTRQIIRA